MTLYNLRNPAVKRLMKEAQELLHPTEEYHAQPLEDNLFEWHFTVKGPPNSDYEGGIYHGRISLPTEYPMKPPSIIILTPNGRFEINKKICLSISGHHPETWQPSWSIRTALLAIIGFMPTHGNGAIGSLDYTPEERKLLALKSQHFKCPECGYIKDIFSKDSARQLNEDDSAKNSVHDTETVHNEKVDVLPVERNASGSVEQDIPTLRTNSTEDTLLVHRNKSNSVQDSNIELNEVRTEHRSNGSFFTFCIICIVFAILLLSLRRLLSL